MARDRGKSSLDLLEEATYLLRSAPAAAVAAYYAGTLPFLLGFLFFWADMSRDAYAPEQTAPAALGVAALFVWMSAWQAVFAQSLRTVLTGGRPASFRRLAFIQATLQPTKFFILPIAAIVTFPLGSVFAFYQNLMTVPYEDAGLREIMSLARRQSRLWPMQNWGAIGLLVVLAVVIFANIGALLFLIPQLLKSFLGIQTELARSQVMALNSTFLAITVALTYAIVDPLIKSVYVLRCFYGESLATGEDLKVQLKSIAAQILLAVVCLSGLALQAQPPAPEMNRSIDEVLKRSEFAWRLPHRAHTPPAENWLTRALDTAAKKLDEWSDAVAKWLHERFRPKQTKGPGKEPLPALRLWFYVLLGIAILIFLVLFIRIFRRRARLTAQAEPLAVASPDLVSDDTRADQLAPDEWLRTARECIARNELRLAIRALYLANLSYLGGNSLIAIDCGKSNNDYARELRRRARSKPEIVPVFSDTVAVFERSWYGMHDVTAELVARVEENLAATRNRVEQ